MGGRSLVTRFQNWLMRGAFMTKGTEMSIVSGRLGEGGKGKKGERGDLAQYTHGSLADQACDGSDELVGLYRLGEVQLVAGRQGAFAIFAGGVAGQGDRWNKS